MGADAHDNEPSVKALFYADMPNLSSKVVFFISVPAIGIMFLSRTSSQELWALLQLSQLAELTDALIVELSDCHPSISAGPWNAHLPRMAVMGLSPLNLCSGTSMFLPHTAHVPMAPQRSFAHPRLYVRRYLLHVSL